MAASLSVFAAITKVPSLSSRVIPNSNISPKLPIQTLVPQIRARISLINAKVRAVSGGTSAIEKIKRDGEVRIIAIVGEESVSPIKETPWKEVLIHIANRLKWVDEEFEMLVFTDKSMIPDNPSTEVLQTELTCCDLLLIVAIKDQNSIAWIQNNSKSIPNVLCFDSSSSIRNKLGGSLVEDKGNNIFSDKKSLEVIKTISDAWERHNSDDIRFCLLVIINIYIKPVPMLQNLRAKGLSTLTCMLTNCGTQVLNCLFDPNCRKALQCLNSCPPTDQVCNYRCIASYESPYLEAFSLCVLQKNNCLELNAEIPKKPFVPPLSVFRRQALNHEIAEDLFIGWLGSLEWSWRVVAGQNPAYDQFPCQYQLFYRGRARGSFWYEPVFQVKTLEGKLVWRRRRYRVRRANVPGTFHFSVLDNGVISKEFWTIVDVSEDFSWGLFHYSGAAEVAGQSYTGAVLVSPDGMYPKDKGSNRLNSALEKCGIKDWELFDVDNCSCDGAPLGIPEGSSLHYVVNAMDDEHESAGPDSPVPMCQIPIHHTFQHKIIIKIKKQFKWVGEIQWAHRDRGFPDQRISTHG